jgi:hypothetical protein
MEADQKDALKLNNEAFEHIVDVCEKEAFKLVLYASQCYYKMSYINI